MGISTNNTYDVIVIGSGLGALSSALHFAKQGLHVLVLEKQPKVGGYAQNYIRGDYYFDVSQHVCPSLRPGQGFHKLLDYLQVMDKLEVTEHQPMFHAEFDGDLYALPGGEEASKDYLKSMFPGENAGIDKYYDIVKKIVDENGDLFWTGQVDLQNFFPAHYLKKSYQDLLDECTSNHKLHGLLGQFWQSTGLPNKQCAANWAAEVMGSHLVTGNFHIEGGGGRLSEAMTQTLREAGGVVQVSSLVKRILTRARRAYGVELESGEQFFAKVIMSGANPRQTYLEMVGKPNLPRPLIYKLDQLINSCSLLTVYLGLNRPCKELGVGQKTLFINNSYDNNRAFQLAMDEQYDRTDFMMSDYTKEGSQNHPVGHGVLQMLEVAPGKPWCKISKDAYREKKERVLSILMDKLDKRYPALSRHIEVCELATPRTMMLATRNTDGAVYGYAQTPEQADMYRFSNKSAFKGLYFCGAWGRGGGGGYMGSLINGRVAWREAMANEGLEGRDLHIPVFKKTEPAQRNANSAVEIKDTFDSEQFTFSLSTEDIAESGEATASSLVRLCQVSADRYLNSRLALLANEWSEFAGTSKVLAAFYHMSFLFVPFVEVHVDESITVTVELKPTEAGKGEMVQNLTRSSDGKKLARSSGRILIRPSA